MKVLIAPDKYKDALDGPAVAEAIRLGVLDARPESEIEICTLADGGEGTGQILASALGAARLVANVGDPLNRRCEAAWWLVAADAHAIVEMAEASGLQRLAPHERSALHTSSFGTGQLLRAAIEAGAQRITLCVGGSATVDGGAGCLQALGWLFFDGDDGRIFEPINGASLARVKRIARPAWSPGVGLTALTDVDNPLLGRNGAAAVFAPQKGASPNDVQTLEANLRHWAHLLADATGAIVHAMRGGGAAGGLPAALAACLGAACEPGFDFVAQQLDLKSKLRSAALCLTGEGRLDEQTQRGKVVAGVARMARETDTPAIAFVGAMHAGLGTPADAARRLGLHDVVVISPPGVVLANSLAATSANLRRSVAQRLRPTR